MIPLFSETQGTITKNSPDTAPLNAVKYTCSIQIFLHIRKNNNLRKQHRRQYSKRRRRRRRCDESWRYSRVKRKDFDKGTRTGRRSASSSSTCALRIAMSPTGRCTAPSPFSLSCRVSAIISISIYTYLKAEACNILVHTE